MLDLGSVDAAALETEALREKRLEGFERKWVMPEDGEGARGETGGRAGRALSNARGYGLESYFTAVYDGTFLP